MSQFTPTLDFPTAFPPLGLRAKLRREPSDFKVTEHLGFTPSGEGEHHLLLVEKTGQNTQWIAGQLAKAVGLQPQAVGFCGRKDRHAVTRQWFSLQLPGQAAPNWQAVDIPGCVILQSTQHIKKLKPGMHAGNHFVLRLTELQDSFERGEAALEEAKQALIDRLGQIKARGVPNYFGYQRFGRQGMNLHQAHAWLTADKSPRRDQRSIVLSSARAYLFNLALAERVKRNEWDQPLKGDVTLDEHPTGPLWGRGRSASEEEALDVEQTALADNQDWLNALEHKGLNQERRSLVLKPSKFSFELTNWGTPDAALTLEFQLETGAFATALLAEILEAVDCAQVRSQD